MFEEKVKLNVVDAHTIIIKNIYDQEFKFIKYLDQNSCEFIVNQCIERLVEVSNERKSFIGALSSVLQTMNICLCYLTTNIDIDSVAYEDLYAMGVFKTIEETLINYNEIKSLVLLSVSLIYDYVIYGILEQLPTTKEMANDLKEITNIFSSNPEKAKEFANIIMANHPELRGFGEIFEKILNNLNKEENEEKNKEE